MGILKLMEFIKTKCPASIMSTAPATYSNKMLAIDASNWMYQFLIKTQTLKSGSVSAPTDPMGNQTGHLIGMMSRIAFCMENKISTVWVFDGKPPQQKYDQLKRRKAKKQQAQQKMEQAKQAEQGFDLLKMSKRTIKITQTEKDYAKKLIQLTGLPMVQSPSEAQPQCAQLVKSDLAYACVSEDMDTLAFGCPRLIRNFSKPEITVQIQLLTLLKSLNLTYQQFVDLCILCGCDYTSRIKNIGPIKAYQYLIKFGNIDRILQQIVKDDKLRKRHTFADDFNHFGARKIFKSPEVMKLKSEDLKVGQFKEQQLREFLTQKEFSQTRIKNWIERVHKSNFFT